MTLKRGDFDNFCTTNIEGVSMKIKPFRQCMFMLDELLSCFECIEFIEPVPETATVYLQEIKQPMDFITLEENLLNNKYKTYQDFRQDLELIWTNATTFHRDFDLIYKQAVALKDRFLTLESYLFSGAKPKFLSTPMADKDTVLFQPVAEEKFSMFRLPMYREIAPHRKSNLYFIQPIPQDNVSSRKIRGYSNVFSLFNHLNYSFFKRIKNPHQTLPLPRFYITKPSELLAEGIKDQEGSIVILLNVQVEPLNSGPDSLSKFSATVAIVEPMSEVHLFDEKLTPETEKYDHTPAAWTKFHIVRIVENVQAVVNSEIDRLFLRGYYRTYRMSVNDTDTKRTGNLELYKMFTRALLEPLSNHTPSSVSSIIPEGSNENTTTITNNEPSKAISATTPTFDDQKETNNSSSTIPLPPSAILKDLPPSSHSEKPVIINNSPPAFDNSLASNDHISKSNKSPERQTNPQLSDNPSPLTIRLPTKRKSSDSDQPKDAKRRFETPQDTPIKQQQGSQDLHTSTHITSRTGNPYHFYPGPPAPRNHPSAEYIWSNGATLVRPPPSYAHGAPFYNPASISTFQNTTASPSKHVNTSINCVDQSSPGPKASIATSAPYTDQQPFINRQLSMEQLQQFTHQQLQMAQQPFNNQQPRIGQPIFTNPQPQAGQQQFIHQQQPQAGQQQFIHQQQPQVGQQQPLPITGEHPLTGQLLHSIQKLLTSQQPLPGQLVHALQQLLVSQQPINSQLLQAIQQLFSKQQQLLTNQQTQAGQQAQVSHSSLTDQEIFAIQKMLSGQQPSTGQQTSNIHKLFSGQQPHIDRQPYSEQQSNADRRPHEGRPPYENRQPSLDRRPYADQRPYIDRRSHIERQPHTNHGPYTNRQPYPDRRPSSERQSYTGRQPSTDRQSYADRHASTGRQVDQRLYAERQPKTDQHTVQQLPTHPVATSSNQRLPPKEEMKQPQYPIRYPPKQESTVYDKLLAAASRQDKSAKKQENINDSLEDALTHALVQQLSKEKVQPENQQDVVANVPIATKLDSQPISPSDEKIIQKQEEDVAKGQSQAQSPLHPLAQPAEQPLAQPTVQSQTQAFTEPAIKPPITGLPSEKKDREVNVADDKLVDKVMTLPISKDTYQKIIHPTPELNITQQEELYENRSKFLFHELLEYSRKKSVPVENISSYNFDIKSSPNAEGYFKQVYFLRDNKNKVVQTFRRMTTAQRVTEIASLLKLKNMPHIGQITEVIEEKGEIIGLSMERYQKTLKQYTHAHSHHRLTAHQKMDLVIQLLECMKTIHDHGLAHRDLSEVNFMVNETEEKLPDGSSKAEVYLIDFGKSTFVFPSDVCRWWIQLPPGETECSDIVPTTKEELVEWCEQLPWMRAKPDHGYRLYRSIQTMPRSRVDTQELQWLINPLAEDMYSIGTIIWKMFSETEPWYGILETDLRSLRDIVGDDYNIEKALEREVPGKLSKQLLLYTLKVAPQERKTAEEILEWIQDPETKTSLVEEWQMYAPVDRQKRHAKRFEDETSSDVTIRKQKPGRIQR